MRESPPGPSARPCARPMSASSASIQGSAVTGWGVGGDRRCNRLTFMAVRLASPSRRDRRPWISRGSSPSTTDCRRVVDDHSPRRSRRRRRPSSTRTRPPRSSSARRAASRMLVPAHRRAAGRRIRAATLVKKTIVGAAPQRQGADPHDGRGAAAEGRPAVPMTRPMRGRRSR